MTNITLYTSTRQCIADNYFLGYEGENKINKLIFKFDDGFRDGLGILNIQRGEEKGYLDLEKVGNTYELEVKSALLTKKGEITFQLTINESDGTVIKYDAFQMVVKDAIDADSEMPEDYPNWVDMANAKLAEVDEAIDRAESVSNQLLEDKANGVFNGKDGINGKDGVSPTVTTEQTAIGAKITITDVNGTHTAEVFNGKDGKDGEDGKTPHIGANGNWWIGDIDTGINPEGSSEGTGGSGTAQTVLWEGLLTEKGQSATLLDSIENYDATICMASHSDGTNTITQYVPFPEINKSYVFGFYWLSGFSYAIVYSFTDSTTLKYNNQWIEGDSFKKLGACIYKLVGIKY